MSGYWYRLAWNWLVYGKVCGKALGPGASDRRIYNLQFDLAYPFPGIILTATNEDVARLLARSSVRDLEGSDVAVDTLDGAGAFLDLSATIESDEALLADERDLEEFGALGRPLAALCTRCSCAPRARGAHLSRFLGRVHVPEFIPVDLFAGDGAAVDVGDHIIGLEQPLACRPRRKAHDRVELVELDARAAGGRQLHKHFGEIADAIREEHDVAPSWQRSLESLHHALRTGARACLLEKPSLHHDLVGQPSRRLASARLLEVLLLLDRGSKALLPHASSRQVGSCIAVLLVTRASKVVRVPVGFVLERT
mmetsp:Transcript_31377/g.81973  ORF Transcript_31377/g.81973 Transcript_31377/m.81973 type:complete len:310 (+) Transcript_31377:176-1105(+)